MIAKRDHILCTYPSQNWTCSQKSLEAFKVPQKYIDEIETKVRATQNKDMIKIDAKATQTTYNDGDRGNNHPKIFEVRATN